jgi:hypothetical protein
MGAKVGSIFGISPGGDIFGYIFVVRQDIYFVWAVKVELDFINNLIM